MTTTMMMTMKMMKVIFFLNFFFLKIKIFSLINDLKKMSCVIFLDDDDDEEESSKITETEAATPSKKAKEPELKEASGKRTKGLPVKGNVFYFLF